MHLDLNGYSYDEAIRRIRALPSAEAQAQALLHYDELLATPGGTALMKEVASPTTPGCQRLYDILRVREAERESKKTASARRKSRKFEGIIKPNLFDIFAEALPPEDIKESHDQN
jgi:hypothetical protein